MQKLGAVQAREHPFSPFDFSCMKRAFALARRGKGKASPNPMVGAVLVKNGNIIGEGWHRRYGSPHAEAEAVKSVLAAGLSPKGAHLYCTLEPCCFNAPNKHQPPCADLIIKSGIKKVFIANTDPNPKVMGKGAAMLEKAGIKVMTGLCAEIGEELNRGFFSFQRLGRPFVHLKMAQSLDGRIAATDGGSRWISDEAARRMVHRFRADYDAVLIGRGTALADNPELTVRLVKGRNPIRVVLDSRLNLPETSKLLRLPEPKPAANIESAVSETHGSPSGRTIIVHHHKADTRKAAALRSSGAQLIPIQADDHTQADGLPLMAVLAELGKQGVMSVLVEGGSGIFSSFLREGFWDRLSLFISPLILGGGINSVSGLGIASMDQAMRFREGSFRRVGLQILFEVNNERSSCSRG